MSIIIPDYKYPTGDDFYNIEVVNENNRKSKESFESVDVDLAKKADKSEVELELVKKVSGSWMFYDSVKEANGSVGDETINTIVWRMKEKSILIDNINVKTTNNAEAYPSLYGTLQIIKYNNTRNSILFFDELKNNIWTINYRQSTSKSDWTLLTTELSGTFPVILKAGNTRLNPESINSTFVKTENLCFINIWWGENQEITDEGTVTIEGLPFPSLISSSEVVFMSGSGEKTVFVRSNGTKLEFFGADYANIKGTDSKLRYVRLSLEYRIAK